MRATPKPYRALEHTADLRLEIRGRTFRDLLKNAVFALADQLVEARLVKTTSSRRVRARVTTPEESVVGLLREVLFLFDAKGFIARTAQKIAFKKGGLEAVLKGEKFSPMRHRPKTEIKAVTFHNLKVRKKRGGVWSAEVVFDV
jgi:protein archease